MKVKSRYHALPTMRNKMADLITGLAGSRKHYRNSENSKTSCRGKSSLRLLTMQGPNLYKIILAHNANCFIYQPSLLRPQYLA